MPYKRSKLSFLVSLGLRQKSSWYLESSFLGWSSTFPSYHHQKQYRCPCWRRCSCNFSGQIVIRGFRRGLVLVCVVRLLQWCGTGHIFGRIIFYLLRSICRTFLIIFFRVALCIVSH